LLFNVNKAIGQMRLLQPKTTQTTVAAEDKLFLQVLCTKSPIADMLTEVWRTAFWRTVA